MYTFLVLGIIPGTDIQIGFWAWIIIMLCVAAVFMKYKQQLQNYLQRWWHQFDEDDMMAERQPLPANRLHLRGL